MDAELARLLRLPDLALRSLGGGVVHADDELFAEKENLLRDEEPGFSPRTFSVRGQVYDGWETRRRREPGHDTAIVRLGVAGVVRAVVVDTRHFTGNYPPEVSVEGVSVPGHPSPAELAGAPWRPLVPRSPVGGDRANAFPVAPAPRCTHVRLSIYPDGGVARLRVHGEVVPDPALLEALGTFDLAALEHGGRVVGCSNRFYGSPERLIARGLARSMGEGWETSRRRDEGHDWVTVRLAAHATVRVAELDTTWFVGNAPGEVQLWAREYPAPSAAEDGGGTSEEAGPAGTPWVPLLPRTRLQPDTVHRFVLPPGGQAARGVRLDAFPDGGMARLRLWGSPTEEGRAELAARWAATAPPAEPAPGPA